ncbi:Ribosomal protein L11 methyltransferase [Campylobacter majalis]|uniref:Ribosomal protein L11 methyltransferase n=1 Tax=Campylobacter majalis TaxID=2790656 RepID=A0ABM8Q6N2_9BACT|nr:50S ribosomal protein L11 methyltransferase [Campylobacter majalis]CAD7288539.1 Ribosomal protein L11 methyltransferase [Campylobacter majalis]
MQDSILNDNYYELSVKTHNFYDNIIDLIFSLGFESIQERDNEIILRDESDLVDVEFGINEYAKALANALNLQNDLTTNITIWQNKDWINEYKKAVKPIMVDNIYIHPSWEEPVKNAINIIIDPALAFGSGHHESTNMCLGLIQKYAKSNMNAIDVGCGSGILSIALAKLGCNVSACDTDELAIQSTLENTKLNNVNIDKIWTGSIAGLDTKYDIVVANIIADVIFMLQNDLKKILKPNGYLILSGILNKYDDRIKRQFGEFELVQKCELNDWISFVFKN